MQKYYFNFTAESKGVLSFKADAVTAADGNVYWNVTDLSVIIMESSNFKVHFDNLFNGDKTLGKKIEHNKPSLIFL